MRADTVPARLSLIFTTALLVQVACTDPGPSSTTQDGSPTTQASSGGGQIDLSTLLGRIVFSAGHPFEEDIYVINADGTGEMRVTTDPSADFDPTWSPDGERIAYRHQTGPGDERTPDIYVIGVDGAGKTNLTRSDGVLDWGPAWSPDGSRIAWNSDRNDPGIGDLDGFVMRPNGSRVEEITDEPFFEYPSWSPDGERIAFMSPVGADYEIFVIDTDGSDAHQLTDSPGDDGWPSWSPDGSTILFASQRDDCSYSDAPDCMTTGDIGPYQTLYVMNADGSNVTRVSDAFGQIADWSPDGRFIVFEDFEVGPERDPGRRVGAHDDPDLGPERRFPRLDLVRFDLGGRSGPDRLELEPELLGRNLHARPVHPLG